MRIRTIKPSFFKDEEIADLDPLNRLLFQGLWLMADSEGRLEDRPRRIKAECLPYDECNIDAMLDELHETRFIIRYQSNDKHCIQIRNFLKHQRLQTKELAIKSEFPGPDGEWYATGTNPVRNGYDTSTQPESQEGKGKEGKGKEERTAGSNIYEARTFESFKTLMPLRNGKFLDEDACRELWTRSPSKWNQWIGAVKNYASSKEVQDGAVYAPLNFLKRKWKDWEQPENGQSQPLGQRPEYGPYDRSWLAERKKDEEMMGRGKA